MTDVPSDPDGVLNDELLFVNGTLMRGLELHGNLAGAAFLEETATAPRYRVHAVNDVHPGMYRLPDGQLGASIPGELYQIPLEVLRRVIEGEPPHLYRGPVELVDGRLVPGILFPRHLAEKHLDITAHGGWHQYRAAVLSRGMPVKLAGDYVIPSQRRQTGSDLTSGA